MKKSMFVSLVVAILAMALLSAPVFGQKKTQAVILADRLVAEPGQVVRIKMILPGDKYIVTCNGDTIRGVTHEVAPVKTTTYVLQAREYGDTTVVAAGKITIGVGKRKRLHVSLPGTFRLGRTNPKEIKGWQTTKVTIDSFLSVNSESSFSGTVTGTADLKGGASEEKNIYLANTRAKKAADLYGLNCKLGKVTGAEERTVYFDYEETDESFFSRVMATEAGIGIVTYAPDSSNRGILSGAETDSTLKVLAPNEISLGIGQQFGHYTGPTAFLGVTWGHSDSVGFLFSLAGTVGQNSVKHDFTETAGLEGIVRYNITKCLGFGLSAGWFYWADVINAPLDSNYKDYEQEFKGPCVGGHLFVGPLNVQYLVASGRRDDRRLVIPDIKNSESNQTWQINLDLIKTGKLVKNIF